MVKVGAVTVKDKPLDRAPPGFTTVTGKNPAVSVRLAGTAAVSCVALTNVVERAPLLQATTEPARKLVPVTVILNPPLPAATELGLNAVIVGVWAPQAPATKPASKTIRTEDRKFIAPFRNWLRRMRALRF